ncbi:murein hydrolase export regulator [Pseudomonas aeruginosa]|nr:murein hydrolase export regulator [Pseudomonas aeruginosa]
MSLDKQALFWLLATVGGYLLSRQLYRRVKWYWAVADRVRPAAALRPGHPHPYPLRRLRP